MAAAEKHPSRRGRTAIDWERAFEFYAALPAGERRLAAVADEFDVSVRTVERHCREEGWRARLRLIRDRVAEETNASIVQARREQKLKLVKLIDATLVGYADKLRRGDVRMAPADLDRLYRLFEQLAADEGRPAATAHAEANPRPRSREQILEVIDALAESGALGKLGLQRIPDISEEVAT